MKEEKRQDDCLNKMYEGYKDKKLKRQIVDKVFKENEDEKLRKVAEILNVELK